MHTAVSEAGFSSKCLKGQKLNPEVPTLGEGKDSAVKLIAHLSSHGSDSREPLCKCPVTTNRLFCCDSVTPATWHSLPPLSCLTPLPSLLSPGISLSCKELGHMLLPPALKFKELGPRETFPRGRSSSFTEEMKPQSLIFFATVRKGHQQVC